jgi:hypothetical protein
VVQLGVPLLADVNCMHRRDADDVDAIFVADTDHVDMVCLDVCWLGQPTSKRRTCTGAVAPNGPILMLRLWSYSWWRGLRRGTTGIRHRHCCAELWNQAAGVIPASASPQTIRSGGGGIDDIEIIHRERGRADKREKSIASSRTRLREFSRAVFYIIK